MRNLLVLTLAALTPSIAVAQAKPEFLNINPQSTAPFTPAVRVGNMIYLAGQLGTKDGKLAPGGIGPETKQALQNIKDLLEKVGSDMEHVVKCTVFLADMKEWPAMNEVYRTMFTAGDMPAGRGVGLNGGPPRARRGRQR